MLKIYGRTTSINVMKVIWTCAELGLEYERKDVGREFGRNRENEAELPPIDDPEYLAMNPNGRIPTIDDDGFVLWESNSIVRYLAGRYGTGGLWPTEPCARADSERWMDWQLTVLILAVNPVFLHLVRTPPEKRDAAAIERGRRHSIAATRILDNHLAKCPYLAGAALTVGDISVGTVVHRWLSLPVERPSMPNLERYYALLAERPGYREHIMRPLT